MTTHVNHLPVKWLLKTLGWTCFIWLYLFILIDNLCNIWNNASIYWYPVSVDGVVESELKLLINERKEVNIFKMLGTRLITHNDNVSFLFAVDWVHLRLCVMYIYQTQPAQWFWIERTKALRIHLNVFVIYHTICYVGQGKFKSRSISLMLTKIKRDALRWIILVLTLTWSKRIFYVCYYQCKNINANLSMWPFERRS